MGSVYTIAVFLLGVMRWGVCLSWIYDRLGVVVPLRTAGALPVSVVCEFVCVVLLVTVPPGAMTVFLVLAFLALGVRESQNALPSKHINAMIASAIASAAPVFLAFVNEL